MKHTLPWLLSGLLAGPALAQTPAVPAPPRLASPETPKGAGRITGVVLDAATKKPVEFATVALLPATGERPLDGTAADERGRFELKGLAAGAYRVQVTFVGYAAQVQAVTVTDGTVDLGSVLLTATAQKLGEVTVTGEKELVETKPDRIVYNAGQDAGNAGGTAADVLRRTPLLAVDGDGNVRMRGSTNFRVLVNNKPSPTLAANLAEALKSIPADQIQSVEVITTPPARYDGEGTAGIINIVLKKGANLGLNGRVGASAGNRNSNLSSSLNFRQGKLNFTSSANVGAWYNPGQIIGERTTFGGSGQELNRISQRAEVDNRGGWVYGTVGADYDLTDQQSLSLAGSVNGYAGYSDNALLNQFTAFDGSPNQQFFRDTRNVFNALNVELTGTYTRKFAAVPRKEWSVLAQFAPTTGLFGYDFAQFNNATGAGAENRADQRERSRGRTPGSETTFQTDFTQPFGEKRTLELGLKAIYRRTSSVARVDTLLAPTGSFAESGQRRTDFGYGQDVQAAYTTYSFGVGKKLTGSLGSRLERTGIEADFRATGTDFTRDYWNLLPNGSAAYAFSEKTSLRLAYSRRITRPFIDFLNPFVDRSNPANYTFGNPDVSPELTHSTELGWSTTRETSSLNLSLSVRHTGNAIEQIRLASTDPAIGDGRYGENIRQALLEVASPAVTAQTYGNVAANTFYQFNIYGSLKPTEGWTISGGPDVQYIRRRSSALGLTRAGWTANLNLNTSYKLPKGWTVQGFVYSGLRTPDLQGFGAANLYYQLGGKKMLMKEKADLTLNFAAPFNRFWPYTSTLNTPFFDETFTYRAFQQGFRLSFNYRFGQQSQGRQRKGVSNDDQKSGGSKQGGQQ